LLSNFESFCLYDGSRQRYGVFNPKRITKERLRSLFFDLSMER